MKMMRIEMEKPKYNKKISVKRLPEAQTWQRRPAPAPKPGKFSKFFEATERYAKLIKNLSIIFGIVFSITAYVSARHDKRVERAIEYNKEFMSTYFYKYSNLSANYDAKFRRPEDIEKPSAVEKFFSDGGNHKNLNDLLDFYDNVWICVRNISCDINTTIETLGKNGMKLYESIIPYLESRRISTGNPEIGRGLEKIYGLHEQNWIATFFPQFFLRLPSKTPTEGRSLGSGQ